MKKTITTLTLILGLAVGATAQGGGLFQRGHVSEETSNRGGSPLLPTHTLTDDQNADAPLGGGMALLAALGVLYAMNRRVKGLKEE